MVKNFRAAGIAAIALGLLAGAATAQTSNAPPKKVTFLTNYIFHGRHTPFFIARDKGFYKEVGLDVDIQPSTGSGFVLSALEGGKADYGMAESASTVQAVSKGAKVKGFDVFMDVTTSGLASLKPFPTPQSVVGHTVGASLTDSVRVILPVIFDQNGLDPAKIDWQTADPGVYASLLFGEKVDIITATFDGDIPALQKLATQQGKQIQFSGFPDWGYDVFGYFLVAKAERLGSVPQEAKGFATATAKAVRFAEENPEEAAKMMVADNPTLNYDTTLTQWRQAIHAIETPYVKQHGYGAATTDRLQRTIDLVSKAMKLEVKLKPEDVYDTTIMAH
jgi:NitT/TauT family transport system substrate-binding protein